MSYFNTPDPIVEQRKQQILNDLIPQVIAELNLPLSKNDQIAREIVSNLYDFRAAFQIFEEQSDQAEIDREQLRYAISLLQPKQVLLRLDQQLKSVNDNSGKVQRVLHLVDQMLKPEERKDIGLNRVIKETLELTPALKTTSITVIKDLDPNLPKFEGNSGEIQRMVLDLLHGSIYRIEARDRRERAADRIIPRGRINICTGICASAIELWLIDNGTAISGENWQQMTDTETEIVPNLAACQRVVQRHQGSLHYMSDSKETAIIARLPI